MVSCCSVVGEEVVGGEAPLVDCHKKVPLKCITIKQQPEGGLEKGRKDKERERRKGERGEIK